MKMRLFALSAGLALLLSACLPDLPDPVGQVEVTVTPGDAAMVSMDWTITGAASFRPEVPVEYEGTCAAGCAQFEETVLMGTWELRVSPPEFTPGDLLFGWVGTGAVDEVSADYVTEFTLEQQETQALEASFRRPNILDWDYLTSSSGEPATVTLTGVVSEAEFELAGLEATCTALNVSFPFVLAGDAVTVGTTAQDLELDYAGELGLPTFPSDSVSCGIDLAWDSDNRPVGTIYVGD